MKSMSLNKGSQLYVTFNYSPPGPETEDNNLPIIVMAAGAMVAGALEIAEVPHTTL